MPPFAPLALLATSLSPFAGKYFSRLKLDPTFLDAAPTFTKLAQIQEAHLATIPFENMAQHGAVGGPAVLDLSVTAQKILDRRRGGFCYEVNGLLALFLEEQGYGVKRVAASVFKGSPDGKFPDLKTHLILLVTCEPGSETESVHLVDVGFGEPALHPLDYSKFGAEQVTPEGMRSKIIQGGTSKTPNYIDDKDGVFLFWYKEGSWKPRLRWSHEATLGAGCNLSDFTEALQANLGPKSNFSRSLIATLLTRDKKVTVAGNQLKITGFPRFPSLDGAELVKPSIRILNSDQEVRSELFERLGVPLEATAGLSLEKSKAEKEPCFPTL